MKLSENEREKKKINLREREKKSLFIVYHSIQT